MEKWKNNTMIEWLYGEIKVDPKEMKHLIDNFLDYSIEPDYKNLYYEDPIKGRIYYDQQVINEFIEKYRAELKEKLYNLDKFQYLINKNSFPENHENYLCTLLQSNNKLFYELMNDGCDYHRGTDFAPFWDENNIELDDYMFYEHNWSSCVQ